MSQVRRAAEHHRVAETAERGYGRELANLLAAPLVSAVIKAESDYNPRIVSHKGARGLITVGALCRACMRIHHSLIGSSGLRILLLDREILS